MPYNPDIHHRRSIRLADYDYSQSRTYFVTICTKDKECLFGEIRDGAMQLNEYGLAATNVWLDITSGYPIIELDEYIIMPNHFHAIVSVVGAGLALPNTARAGAASSAPIIS